MSYITWKLFMLAEYAAHLVTVLPIDVIFRPVPRFSIYDSKTVPKAKPLQRGSPHTRRSYLVPLKRRLNEEEHP
jgi:hypothetical protein